MSVHEPEWYVVCTWGQEIRGKPYSFAHQSFFSERKEAWEFFHSHKMHSHPHPQWGMLLVDRRTGEWLAEWASQPTIQGELTS